MKKKETYSPSVKHEPEKPTYHNSDWFLSGCKEEDLTETSQSNAFNNPEQYIYLVYHFKTCVIFL